MSTALPDGGSVLLDLESELYFGLNSVGTQIWSLIGEGHSAGEVIEQLADDHPSQEQSVIETDFWALVGQLREKALLAKADDIS